MTTHFWFGGEAAPYLVEHSAKFNEGQLTRTPANTDPWEEGKTAIISGEDTEWVSSNTITNVDQYPETAITKLLIDSQVGIFAGRTVTKAEWIPELQEFWISTLSGGATGYAMSSEDGYNWELRMSYSGQDLNDFDYGDGYIVFSTQGGSLRLDVNTGAVHYASTTFSGGSNDGIATDGNGNWVIGNQGTHIYYSTDNAQTWSPTPSPAHQYTPGNGLGFYCAAYGAGKFVACDQYGNAMISTDGSEWSYVSEGSSVGAVDYIGTNNMVWTGELFYGQNKHSYDGITWIHNGQAGYYNSYGNGVYLYSDAGTSSGSSSDPVVWYSYSLGAGSQWFSYPTTFLNGGTRFATNGTTVFGSGDTGNNATYLMSGAFDLGRSELTIVNGHNEAFWTGVTCDDNGGDVSTAYVIGSDNTKITTTYDAGWSVGENVRGIGQVLELEPPVDLDQDLKTALFDTGEPVYQDTPYIAVSDDVVSVGLANQNPPARQSTNPVTAQNRLENNWDHVTGLGDDGIQSGLVEHYQTCAINSNGAIVQLHWRQGLNAISSKISYDDGTTWSQIYQVGPQIGGAFQIYFNCLVGGGSKVHMVGNGDLYSSSDGATWTQTYPGFSSTYGNKIGYIPETNFHFAGDNQTLAYSVDDCANFYAMSTPPVNLGPAQGWIFDSDNYRMVCLSADSTKLVTFGAASLGDWQTYDLPAGLAYGGVANPSSGLRQDSKGCPLMHYVNGRFVFITYGPGYTTECWTSRDLVTFEKHSIPNPSTSSVYSLAKFGNVVMFTDNAVFPAQTFASADGENWHRQNLTGGANVPNSADTFIGQYTCFGVNHWINVQNGAGVFGIRATRTTDTNVLTIAGAADDGFRSGDRVTRCGDLTTDTNIVEVDNTEMTVLMSGLGEGYEDNTGKFQVGDYVCLHPDEVGTIYAGDTELTLAGPTDLEYFISGNTLSQLNTNNTGVIGSVDIANNKITLTSKVDGFVTGTPVTSTATASAVCVSAGLSNDIMVVRNTVGKWAIDRGKYIKGTIRRLPKYQSETSLLIGAEDAGVEYKIEQSLIFNGNTNWLSRGFTTVGDRRTWTWSGWAKMSKITPNYAVLFGTNDYSTNYLEFGFYYTGQFYFSWQGGGSSSTMLTNETFNDTSGWAHIVVAVDTNAPNTLDRIKVYADGVQLTWETGVSPSQGFETQVNTATTHEIARRVNENNLYYNGYLADVQFVDGEAHPASKFGYFDAYGFWNAKGYQKTYDLSSILSANTLDQLTSTNTITAVTEQPAGPWTALTTDEWYYLALGAQGDYHYDSLWSNGVYITSAARGIGRSTDGINWTNPVAAENQYCKQIATDGNGTWAVIKAQSPPAGWAGQVYFSTDNGLTWELKRIKDQANGPTGTPTVGKNFNLTGLAYGDGKWIVLGSQTTSNNNRIGAFSATTAELVAETWTYSGDWVSSTTWGNTATIKYGNGVFVANIDQGTGARFSLDRYSDDGGVTWKNLNPGWSNSATFGPFCMDWSEQLGQFSMLRSGGTVSQKGVWTSNDGINWEQATHVTPSGHRWDPTTLSYLFFNSSTLGAMSADFSSSTTIKTIPNGAGYIQYLVAGGPTRIFTVPSGSGYYGSEYSVGPVNRLTIAGAASDGFEAGDAIYNGAGEVADTIMTISDTEINVTALNAGFAVGDRVIRYVEGAADTRLTLISDNNFDLIEKGDFVKQDESYTAETSEITAVTPLPNGSSPSSDATAFWRNVAEGNGTWVAVATEGVTRIMYSTDNGQSWTNSNIADASIYQWSNVVWTGSYFVAISLTGHVGRSSDGINWSLTTGSVATTSYGMAYGDGKIVVTDDSTNGSGVMISTNEGISFATSNQPYNLNYYSVTYGNGMFVAIGNSNPYSAYRNISYATDPAGTWSSALGISQNGWVDIAFGNGRFVAVSQGSYIMYSDDAINWTEATSYPAGFNFNTVTYGNGTWVAAEYSSDSRVCYSTDNGVTWQTTELPAAGEHQGIGFGNNKFVLVGNGGTDVSYSTTGRNWLTPDSSLTFEDSTNLDVISVGDTTTNGEEVFAVGPGNTMMVTGVWSVGQRVAVEFAPGFGKIVEWTSNGNVIDCIIDGGRFIGGGSRKALLVKGSYGKNGFHLPLAAADLGEDVGGGSNDWTPNGIFSFYYDFSFNPSTPTLTYTALENMFDGDVETYAYGGSVCVFTFNPPIPVANGRVDLVGTTSGNTGQYRIKTNVLDIPSGQPDSLALTQGGYWPGTDNYDNHAHWSYSDPNITELRELQVEYNGSNWLVAGIQVAGDPNTVGTQLLTNVGGGPSPAGAVDSPTLYGTETGVGGEVRGNYSTLDAMLPAIPMQATATLSNGNLTGSSANGNFGGSFSNFVIEPNTGKWYWEAVCNNLLFILGVEDASATPTGAVGSSAGSYTYEAQTGNKKSGGSSTAYGSYAPAGTVIGVAYDSDAGSITFYPGGVSQGVAYSGITSPVRASFGENTISGGSASITYNVNFGQREFTYTAPADHKTLNTHNL